jgi:two-component system chemotaxis response regulator CheY
MDSIRLLIVDDSRFMRKVVERALLLADFHLKRVFEAGNGIEALTILAKNPVDLILCDINMPGMDGLEFLKRRTKIENAKGVPVVMITSESSEADVAQALSFGACGYIRKPFTPGEIRDQILPILARES